MKNLAFSYLIVLAGCAITFGHQVLEKREIRPNLSALPKGIVTLEGFGLPWYLMIAYGTLILFATQELGGAIGGLIASPSDASEGDAIILALIFGSIISLVVAYFLGGWCGSRCASNGVITVLAVIFIGKAAAVSFDFFLLSGDDWESLAGVPKSIGAYALGIIAGTLVLMPFGLIGYWRGRRARLTQYLRYLLGVLPIETRNTIVALAYEEAQKPAPDG